jgi:dTDP-4-dehydrorhamnose reductase
VSTTLVTGGGGQLAPDFTRALAGPVYLLGRDELDVTDEASVQAAVARVQPGLVVHCAAWTDVDGAEADPEGARRINEDGSRLVARAAHAAGAGLLAFSTDYVFAGDDARGYDESAAPVPQSVYGATKLAGEHAVREEHPGAHVVRTAWVFGPRGRNFVRTMLRLGAERDELQVVDDQRGCPTYTLHLARAAAELVERCPPGTYHLAGAGDCTWRELAQAVMDGAGLRARVEPISSDRLARAARRPACSILRTLHPHAPRLPHWREGLDECLAELRGDRDEGG